jgi:hypothetical protein
MWRFLLPALTTTAALIVLFAGVMGDLRSLPDLSNWAVAITGGAEPRPAPQLATPPPRPRLPQSSWDSRLNGTSCSVRLPTFSDRPVICRT